MLLALLAFARPGLVAALAPLAAVAALALLLALLAVARPGLVKRIEVNVRAQEATITESRQGLFGTIRYLHLNPGPHRQPQWIGTKAWAWIVDTTVYVTLALTLSGIYLWAFIREERKVGIVVLGAGAVSFVAILYALMIA